MTGAAAHYIISPKIIYLIHLAQGISDLLGAILIIGGCILGFVTGFILLEHEYFEEEEEKAVKKYYPRSIIAYIILAIVYIIVPNKETCTKMLIASYVTEENISATQENVKEAIDYIFEKVEEVNKKEGN